MEKLFSQVVVPVVGVVVEQQELASVQVSHSPNTVFIVGAEVSNTGLLGWRNNLKVSGFVDFFVSDTVEIDSLDKNEFL